MKTLRVVPKPEDFRALVPRGEGFIEYTDTAGKNRRLEVNWE